MSTTVLDNIHGWFTPGTIHQAASLAGESDAKTESSIDGIASTILAGIWQKLSTVAGERSITNLISQLGSQQGMLRGLVEGTPQAADNVANAGRSGLSTIFGDRLDRVVQSVSSSNDLSHNSANTLMSVAAPIVLSSLATEAGSQRLQGGALKRILASSWDWISRKMPAGMPSLLGISGVEEDRLRRPTAAAAQPGSAARWFVPLLLAIVLIGLLSYFLARRGARTAAQAPPTPAPVQEPVGRAPVTAPVAPPATTESPAVSSLEQYLNNPSDTQVPKSFTLDNMNFGEGSTKLMPASTQTVKSLAVVMKGHPSTQIRLTGYTDSIGNDAANRTLSENRAEEVKNMLVSEGVDASRIETRGMGEENPIASNDTESGRAQNRRLDLDVTSK